MPILLYGCTTSTLTKSMEKKLGFIYCDWKIVNAMEKVVVSYNIPLHIYIYIYNISYSFCFPHEKSIAMRPTKLSSDDDSGGRHNFSSIALSLLTQSTQTVLYNKTIFFVIVFHHIVEYQTKIKPCYIILYCIHNFSLAVHDYDTKYVSKKKIIMIYQWGCLTAP